MIKAVLDANILVSALLTSKGHPARILTQWKIGTFDLVVSPSILQEIARVLFYPKIRKRICWSDSELSDFLVNLTRFGIMVTGEPVVDLLKEDPADNKYLACAQKSEADFIVSGDHHLLELRNYKGTRIITPKAFLTILLES